MSLIFKRAPIRPERGSKWGWVTQCVLEVPCTSPINCLCGRKVTATKMSLRMHLEQNHNLRTQPSTLEDSGSKEGTVDRTMLITTMATNYKAHWKPRRKPSRQACRLGAFPVSVGRPLMSSVNWPAGAAAEAHRAQLPIFLEPFGERQLKSWTTLDQALHWRLSTRCLY